MLDFQLHENELLELDDILENARIALLEAPHSRRLLHLLYHINRQTD